MPNPESSIFFSRPPQTQVDGDQIPYGFSVNLLFAIRKRAATASKFDSSRARLPLKIFKIIPRPHGKRILRLIWLIPSCIQDDLSQSAQRPVLSLSKYHGERNNKINLNANQYNEGNRVNQRKIFLSDSKPVYILNYRRKGDTRYAEIRTLDRCAKDGTGA
jgi:hypothetical protein